MLGVSNLAPSAEPVQLRGRRGGRGRGAAAARAVRDRERDVATAAEDVLLANPTYACVRLEMPVSYPRHPCPPTRRAAG